MVKKGLGTIKSMRRCFRGVNFFVFVSAILQEKSEHRLRWNLLHYSNLLHFGDDVEQNLPHGRYKGLVLQQARVAVFIRIFMDTALGKNCSLPVPSTV